MQCSKLGIRLKTGFGSKKVSNEDNLRKARKEVIQIWQEKLLTYQREESITNDIGSKFELSKRIEECKQKIKELQAPFLSQENKAVTTETTLQSAPIAQLSLAARKLKIWYKSGYKDFSQLLNSAELKARIEKAANQLPPVDINESTLLIESIIWQTQRPQKRILKQHWTGAEVLMKPPYEAMRSAWQNSQQRQQALLLKGAFLEKTIRWVSGRSVSNQDRDFLIASIISTGDCEGMVLEEDKLEISQSIKSQWQGLTDKTENPYTTLQEVLSWTECQPFLTQKIIEFISLENSKIIKGEESQRVRLIVERNFTKEPENLEIARHFHSLHELVTRNERQNPFWLLFGYRKGLKEQRNSEKYSTEVRSSIIFLQSIGLLTQSAGNLKVRSRIYQSIFDEVWVHTQLMDLRPYAQKFVNWLDTDCKDDGYLLEEEEIHSAMKWKKDSGVVFTTLEEKFLAYSLDNYM